MRGRSVGAIVACATLALPALAAANSKTVLSGGPLKFQNQIGKQFSTGVDAFMIPKVTINVGDTVVWDGKTRQNGFHSIDFPKKGGKPLPLILPTGKTVTGVLDFANNPFWFDGKVPELGFNPALFAPSTGGTYNGSKAIDSGLPVQQKVADFKLKFTKAGTYKYYCNVHPGMVGVVVVLAKGKKVPSARDDAKTLAKSETAYIAGSKKLVKTKPTGANVDVGAVGANGLELFAMSPTKLTVKTGTTVKFSMAKRTREVHTATFGPSGYVNALANAFATAPTFPGNAIYPSDPPGTVTLNQTSHGNGFANTGAMDDDKATPLPSSGTIKFTQPGTYNFICLVHPFMHGTVVVTP